jgi:hypothetical protein
MLFAVQHAMEERALDSAIGRAARFGGRACCTGEQR